MGERQSGEGTGGSTYETKWWRGMRMEDLIEKAASMSLEEIQATIHAIGLEIDILNAQKTKTEAMTRWAREQRSQLSEFVKQETAAQNEHNRERNVTRRKDLRQLLDQTEMLMKEKRHDEALVSLTAAVRRWCRIDEIFDDEDD
jgi:uncharacterized coiled-coil DUF342 family protein